MAKIAPKHPGKTPAQRRILDEIGSGNFTPFMTDKVRDRMLADGLIASAGKRAVHYFDGMPPMYVTEWMMPIPVHMAWCNAMSAEIDKLPLAERKAFLGQ